MDGGSPGSCGTHVVHRERLFLGPCHRDTTGAAVCKDGEVSSRCQGLLRGRRPWPASGLPRRGDRHRGDPDVPRSVFPTIAPLLADAPTPPVWFTAARPPRCSGFSPTDVRAPRRPVSTPVAAWLKRRPYSSSLAGCRRSSPAPSHRIEATPLHKFMGGAAVSIQACVRPAQPALLLAILRPHSRV
jgi:hypothetical protein